MIESLYVLFGLISQFRKRLAERQRMRRFMGREKHFYEVMFVRLVRNSGIVVDKILEIQDGADAADAISAGIASERLRGIRDVAYLRGYDKGYLEGIESGKLA